MIVTFASQFQQGSLNNERFKDLPYLNDAQLEMLLHFIHAVEQNQPLPGKNKTSWQTNQGLIIEQTGTYQHGNHWHYHCGPYKQAEPECYTINLCWNIKGLTSAAVLHYQKISDNEIYLLAYSPKHTPFPAEVIANNPLIQRMQAVR